MPSAMPYRQSQSTPSVLPQSSGPGPEPSRPSAFGPFCFLFPFRPKDGSRLDDLVRILLLDALGLMTVDGHPRDEAFPCPPARQQRAHWRALLPDLADWRTLSDSLGAHHLLCHSVRPRCGRSLSSVSEALRLDPSALSPLTRVASRGRRWGRRRCGPCRPRCVCRRSPDRSSGLAKVFRCLWGLADGLPDPQSARRPRRPRLVLQDLLPLQPARLWSSAGFALALAVPSGVCECPSPMPEGLVELGRDLQDDPAIAKRHAASFDRPVRKPPSNDWKREVQRRIQVRTLLSTPDKHVFDQMKESLRLCSYRRHRG